AGSNGPIEVQAVSAAGGAVDARAGTDIGGRRDVGPVIDSERQPGGDLGFRASAPHPAGCGVIVERILEEPGGAPGADGVRPRLESVTLAFDVDLVRQQPRGPKGDPVP